MTLPKSGLRNNFAATLQPPTVYLTLFCYLKKNNITLTCFVEY